MSTLQLFGKFGVNVHGGEAGGDVAMDFLSDTIKFTLHTTTQTVNLDTDEAFATWSATELATANGYTAGGIAIGTKTATYNATGGVTTFDMDDTTVTWTASGAGITFRYALLWDDTTTAPVDALIGYIDTTGSGNQTITAGNTLTITTGANGLYQATVTGA
jgi:hypothetical protein